MTATLDDLNRLVALNDHLKTRGHVFDGLCYPDSDPNSPVMQIVGGVVLPLSPAMAQDVANFVYAPPVVASTAQLRARLKAAAQGANSVAALRAVVQDLLDAVEFPVRPA